ncbi:MAG TPA: S8 family peptidase [Flavisolibacter sp.]|nr:S8 family peptidase [Flavisolibacter sp.]
MLWTIYIADMMRSWLILLFMGLTMWVFAQNKDVENIKLSPLLHQRLKAAKDDDSIVVSISLKKKTASILTAFRLREQHAAANVYNATLLKTALLRLAVHPDVTFISEYNFPQEELNTGAVDYTLNKINKAHHAYPDIRGDSIFISVKERAFDTTDIDLKGRVFPGMHAPVQSSHAAIMATIIAGAGNSSPFALGVASGSFVSSADFTNLFPEEDTFYRQRRITVQNHSYGTVVENFYGNEAMAYDLNMMNNPTLLQVFSAGNSGGITPTVGTYSGVMGMANLTGNFKQSKNTISVAALDSAGSSMQAASKGPAFDGRLKPELAAYGEDGSSGAAALVSGTAALVQDAYKKLKGRLPASELVKVILINSADDAGLPGIDYATGYGSLNAWKALEAVQQNRFIEGEVIQNGVKRFSINVPANIARLKVSLSWNDPPAFPNASRVLVNDLDLLIKEVASGLTWEPWVLNSKANKDSLLLKAVRRKDTLNNTEQVTLDVPAAGVYQIEIRGTGVTSTQQSFAVSYQLDTAEYFTWDFPTASDVLLAGTKQMVRWSSTISGNGQLHYSMDGLNWKAISAINLSGNQYSWEVPDTLTTALLRISNGAAVFTSDTFIISPQPGLQVGFNCSDSFLLFWEKLPAAHYELYQLGNKVLEPFQFTSDTAVVIKKQLSASRYYSLVPLVGNRKGFRSNTIPYDATGTGCYFVSFYLQAQTSSVARFTAELGTLFGVKELSLQKLTSGGTVIIQSNNHFAGTQISFSDSSLQKGENRYRLKLTLQSGAVLYSDVESIYHLAESPVYVYPNPARQNEPIKIINKEAGRYSIKIFNSAGVEIYYQMLTASPALLPAYKLAKGFYIIRILDLQGNASSQKLVIY